MNNHTDQLRHEDLLQLFTTEYEKYASRMDPEVMDGLWDIAPMVFSKWYYTALTGETILTPANIIHCDEEDPKVEKAYILHVDKKAAGMEKYSFHPVSYTLENHPILRDMQTILDACLPDCTVDENGFFLPEDRAELLQKITLPDGFYLEYLTRLCQQMGFFQKVPAIHIHKVTKSPKADAFFAKEPKEALDTLLWEGCALAAERLQYTMDLEPGMVSSSFFYQYLENHIDIDQVFVDFYKRVDIDLESIWKTPPNELTEEEQSIVSSFLFAGIMMDKWVFTPLGHFFHVVRPISFTAFRFYQNINNLAALFLMHHNPGAELFTPPSYCSLTAIGMELTAKEKLSVNKQKMPKNISFERIMEAITPELELRYYEEMLRFELVTDVVSLRATLQKDENLWKEAELSTENLLHDFCCDIFAAFAMEDTREYVLSIPDDNGFPMEYAPAASKRAINKTDGLTLGDLPLHIGDVWTLTPPSGKAGALTIEVLEKKASNPYLMYPRICRQSEKITEMEQIDEIY